MRTASSSVNSCAVAHPVPEQVGVDRRVGDLAEVRAGVGERHHRARMAHDRQQHVGILRVEARLDEELAEVGLEREVDHRLDRVTPRCAGDVGDVGFGGSPCS